MTAADPNGLIGRVFDKRYEVTGLLGRGGMSVVYRAKTVTGDRRVVALKVLPRSLAEDEKQILRFTQEAKACAKLNHPNIIKVFDFGQSSDGLLFIAMELLEGKTLGAIIKGGGPVPQSKTCQIMRQVCIGLTEAHGFGIIHRDLKPENVFLCGTGEAVKILDFGIAKVVGEQGASETLTQTGYICGTPLYISPEQALGKQLDGRTDLYSVGVMMFEMLAGKPPFGAESPIALVMKHIHDAPPTLRSINPAVNVPPALEELCFRLLEKERERRPRTPMEVANLLEGLAATTSSAPVARPVARPTTIGRAMPVARPVARPASPSPMAQAPAGASASRFAAPVPAPSSPKRSASSPGAASQKPTSVQPAVQVPAAVQPPAVQPAAAQPVARRAASLAQMPVAAKPKPEPVLKVSEPMVPDEERTVIELSAFDIEEEPVVGQPVETNEVRVRFDMEGARTPEQKTTIETPQMREGDGAPSGHTRVIEIELPKDIPVGRTGGSRVWWYASAGLAVALAAAGVFAFQAASKKATPPEGAPTPETVEAPAAPTKTHAQPVIDVEDEPETLTPAPEPAEAAKAPEPPRAPAVVPPTPADVATAVVLRTALDAEPRERRGLEVTLQSVPAAPGGEAAPTKIVYHIETVPSGAVVVVNRKAVGKTPFAFEATSETPETNVLFTLPGYLPEEWRYHPGISAPPGQDKVKIVLRPLNIPLKGGGGKPPKKKVKWED